MNRRQTMSAELQPWQCRPNTGHALPFNPEVCQSSGTSVRRPQARHSMPASSVVFAILRVGAPSQHRRKPFVSAFLIAQLHEAIRTRSVGAKVNVLVLVRGDGVGARPRFELRWLGRKDANGGRTMRSAYYCYVHAVECGRLAKVTHSDLTATGCGIWSPMAEAC